MGSLVVNVGVVRSPALRRQDAAAVARPLLWWITAAAAVALALALDLAGWMRVVTAPFVLIGVALAFAGRRRNNEACRRAEVLADASSAVAASFDENRMIASLAEALVPKLTAGCAIELRGPGSERRSARAGELDPAKAVRVPVHLRGEEIGALTASPGSRRPSSSYLALLDEIAHRLATAVEGARLYRASCEAIRVRDEFLTVAAHELRTPLTTLMLNVQSLLRLIERAPEAPIPAERVAAAERQIARLTSLVEHLLDASRVDDAVSLTLEPVELTALVRGVVDAAGQEIRSRGVAVTVCAASPVVGRWDRVRLARVVSGLLSNALKYGLGQPVRIEVERAGDLVTVAVRDRGIGIAAQDLARLFHPFGRAAPVRHYGGLGLTLWIARRTVRAMGGDLHVESASDGGATFTVVLDPNGAAEVAAAGER